MKILICRDWIDADVKRLREVFPGIEIVHEEDYQKALVEAEDSEILFGHISEEMFQRARKLRWIQSPGAGVDWITHCPSLIASDIPLTNTSGAHTETIAEHTFGLLIYLARHFRDLDEGTRNRVWLNKKIWPYMPVGLSGLTLGVLGFGRIGREIGRIGRAFNMRIIACDVNDIPTPEYVSAFYKLDTIDAFLSECDALAVTAPVTEASRNLLSAEKLALLKPSAFLILLSRGEIVDQNALASMLKDGRLAGAGLDATDPEPLPKDHELWSAPNLMITPHCSSRSYSTFAKATDIFIENIKRFQAGEPFINLIDKQRGY